VKLEGSALHALFVRAFYRLFRGLADVPIALDSGEFALMDRKVVNELLALPETDQFLRGLRAWVGFVQTGVDYVRPKRPFGRSTHTWLKNLWWARKAIFSFSFVPIELLGYLAAALATLSVCGLAYQGVDILRRPDVPHAASIIVLVVALFGSLNLLAVTIVGEYVIKIVEETKRRPKFIRKAIRYGREHLETAAAIEGFLERRSRHER
jgi:dolichol-phosphate mannosyltransferase